MTLRAPKLTKAQRAFLRRHRGDEVLGRYDLSGSGGRPTYDFLGRCQNAGLIEIIDGNHSGWPYTWEGTRITTAGRAALNPEVKDGQ